ncbi:MAG: hypothetical protein J6M21_00245 [Campylobacter sp.]|nr:hypothetical protein [Campylobacter sp.]
MSKHRNFIETPIFNILQECVLACNGLDDGIETQPLHEYIMQSVFLKMTGASEQKLKCICWEMATEDYEYRYNFLKGTHGECSSYTDKNDIYNEIIENIKKYEPSFNASSLISDKAKFLNDLKDEIKNLIEKSIISKWLEREFNFFKEETISIELDKNNKFESFSGGFFATNYNQNTNNQKKEKIDFLISNKLFEKSLEIDFTKYVYNHRNRCAHNLISYQENLPTLSTLADENYKYQNYFYRFYILILLDKIFMKLYAKYLDAIENYHI